MEVGLFSGRDDDEEDESDEDEDLSKALHETLNLKYPPPYGTSNIAPAYTPSMTPALRFDKLITFSTKFFPCICLKSCKCNGFF